MPAVELELADHVADRDQRGAAVVARGDRDAGLDGALQEDDQALVQGVALLDDEVRDAGPDAVVDDPAVGQDRRDERDRHARA